jgi:hypothetical protein
LSNIEQTFWYGTAPDATVEIDSSLRAARLFAGSVHMRATKVIGGQAVELTPIQMLVSITWSSTDSIDKYAGTVVTHYPGYQQVSHLSGLYRLGTATGTISGPNMNVFPTVAESSFVQLYRLTGGESILIKE